MPAHDVLVIGGGPAGATTAALLARGGADVLVLEKEHFPRFHIGESLLPRSVPMLAELGVDLAGPAFRYKGGAEFFDEVNGSYALYPFADALPGGPCARYAYQVDRAGFDAALLESARAHGASVVHGERALRVEVDAQGVTVETDRTTHRTRYLVDATGQDAFFARRDRTAVPMDDFGRAAVFTHFVDLSDEGLAALGPDGNIKVLMREDGWTWLIPLSGRRVSIGCVTRRGPVTEALLDETMQASPLTGQVIAGATRLGTRVVRNFSYRNTKSAGARYTTVGDAACFLDPVFSSGVALAMLGASAVAEQLLPALERGTEDDAGLMTPAHEKMAHAYTCVSALIHAFYHTRMVKNLFFARQPDPVMRAGLISMLAGDLWRSDNPFQEALMRSKRRLAPVGA
jgi:flavin-dependent dehydrogenase